MRKNSSSDRAARGWVLLAGDNVTNPVAENESEFTFFPEGPGQPLTLREAESPCLEPDVGTTYGKIFPYRNLTTTILVSGDQG